MFFYIVTSIYNEKSTILPWNEIFNYWFIVLKKTKPTLGNQGVYTKRTPFEGLDLHLSRKYCFFLEKKYVAHSLGPFVFFLQLCQMYIVFMINSPKPRSTAQTSPHSNRFWTWATGECYKRKSRLTKLTVCFKTLLTVTAVQPDNPSKVWRKPVYLQSLVDIADDCAFFRRNLRWFFDFFCTLPKLGTLRIRIFMTHFWEIWWGISWAICHFSVFNELHVTHYDFGLGIVAVLTWYDP